MNLPPNAVDRAKSFCELAEMLGFTATFDFDRPSIDATVFGAPFKTYLVSPWEFSILIERNGAYAHEEGKDLDDVLHRALDRITNWTTA